MHHPPGPLPQHAVCFCLPRAPRALFHALPTLQMTYHARLFVAEVGFPNFFLLGPVLVPDGGAPKTRWPQRNLHTLHAAFVAY